MNTAGGDRPEGEPSWVPAQALVDNTMVKTMTRGFRWRNNGYKDAIDARRALGLCNRRPLRR